MKKNIVIGILIIIIASFMVYAKIKADEATSMAQKAMEYQLEAEKERKRAGLQQQLTQQNAAEARAAQAEAERAIAECNAR